MKYKNNILNKILLLGILTIFAQLIEINESQAGILVRNSNNVIRVGSVRSNVQQYRVKRSTSLMKRTGGSVLRARPFGGVPVSLRIIKANYKYEAKLAKWEEKQEKAAAKLVKKRADLAKKESLRREKAAKRQAREAAKKQKLEMASHSSSSPNIVAANQSSRGSLGTTTNSSNPQMLGKQPKKGFWASLVQALFGKSFSS